MKSKSVLPILAIFCILSVACLIVGCEMLGQSSQKPSLKLVTEPNSGTQDRIGLEDAIGALRSDDFGRMNRAGNYTIHYIHGEDIDPSGNAKSWVIAVRNNQTQFYFEYDGQNSKTYPWNEKNIGKPILVDEIIMPKDLLVLHGELATIISGDRGETRREISLENSIYTLTITKNIPVEYSYNAYSGVAITK